MPFAILKLYIVLTDQILELSLYIDNLFCLTTKFHRYVSPEYASTGMLNEGSDVYSFGVLLMEIVTGRSPIDYSRPPGEVIAGFSGPLFFSSIL